MPKYSNNKNIGNTKHVYCNYIKPNKKRCGKRCKLINMSNILSNAYRCKTHQMNDEINKNNMNEIILSFD